MDDQTERAGQAEDPTADQRRQKYEEDFRRKLEEYDREKYKEITAKAFALGFSSWEEYEEYSMDEYERKMDRWENRMREQAVLEGKTLKQVQDEYWAPQDFRYDGGPDCDCDEHPIPFFCRQSLVNYSSQDFPERLDRQPRLQVEELKIKPDSLTRRLPDAALEKAWARTPPTSSELPFWSKGDKVLQEIVHSSALFPHRVGGSREGSTPSLVSAESGCTPSPTPPLATPTNCQNDTVHEIHQSIPLPESQHTRLMLEIKNAPKRRKRGALLKFKQISKITKRSPPPAMRTRSHRVMKFYELSRDGAPRPSQ